MTYIMCPRCYIFMQSGHGSSTFSYTLLPPKPLCFKTAISISSLILILLFLRQIGAYRFISPTLRNICYQVSDTKTDTILDDRDLLQREENIGSRYLGFFNFLSGAKILRTKF